MTREDKESSHSTLPRFDFGFSEYKKAVDVFAF